MLVLYDNWLYCFDVVFDCVLGVCVIVLDCSLVFGVFG